ncbi:MAG: hypothetical protein CMF23_10645 [Ignavibacteriae bacterium]|nr:hypothetical protein [Ignavibacteriota bacterium]
MISVIYIYYNSSDVIFNSIDSVLKSDYKYGVEIIIVVNKCSDIPIEQLKYYSDKIIVIQNKENLGFGRANNIGVQNSKGEFTLILNPDTIVKENVFSYLINKMNEDSQIGLCTSKLINELNQIQRTSIYKKYNLIYLFIEYFFINKIPIIKYISKNYIYSSDDYNKNQFPEVISGAFILIRKKIYEKLGGFDEDFFMYGEDHNLCLRANKMTKIGYFPEVEVIHFGAHSLGNNPSEYKLGLMIDSLFLNNSKIFHPIKVFVFKILLLLNSVLFWPTSFFLSNSTHKKMLAIRSKLILKKILFSKNGK